MYTAVVWPQGATVSEVHLGTFVSIYGQSLTWDTTSENENDRTVYYEDTEGTLTLQDVQMAIYGLDGFRSQQKNMLENAYLSAASVPISFTTSYGVTKLFDTDSKAISNLGNTLQGCSLTQTLPPGFFWVSYDNSHVDVTYEDLQYLAMAIFGQSATAFARLQTRKAALVAATTLTEIQAVVW